MKTLREMEREYNIRFKGDPDMKLSDWMRENGLDNLANALERADKKKKKRKNK